MRPRFKRLAATVAAGLCLIVPGTAHAGIWTTVTTPTTQTITAIDYQQGSANRLWFTTPDKIYRRNGDGWLKELDAPGAEFSAIEFNPAGSVGVAGTRNGEIYLFSGGKWTKQPPLVTYNYPYQSCPGQGSYTLSAPVTDPVTRVRWFPNGVVYVFVQRYGALLRSTSNGTGFTEVNRKANGTCPLDGWVNDLFTLPANSNYMWFLGGYYNSILYSSTGLQSTVTYRGSACGNRISVDPDNTQRIAIGGPGCRLFATSEDGGQHFSTPQLMNGGSSDTKAFDASGSTMLGVGDAGYIYTSVNRREAYLQPADGGLETNDWRAADLASPTQGAIGGTNGGLAISNLLDTVPDIIKPTGSIGGPENGTTGTPLTFTAEVADGGSGIDPNGLSWTKDRAAVGTGSSLTLAFPESGYYTIELTFRDRAGNTETARKYVTVSTPQRTDYTDPSGRITGPEFAVAGEPARFTVSATDAETGINPSSFRWSRGFRGVGASSPSLSVTFPEPGTDTISVSFSDNAGNDGSASVSVPVAPKPEDRPKPTTAPGTTKPTIKRAKGGKFTIPIKGGYTLPKGVTANLGCQGEVLFTMKKAKTLISARSTALSKACRYRKSFTIAKGKVGAAKTVAITIRFAGNAWLAPVKKTYQVSVPKR